MNYNIKNLKFLHRESDQYNILFERMTHPTIYTKLEIITTHILVYNIIWIVGISHSVSTSQQHLEWDVRDEFPHIFQPFPWALM